MEIPLKPETKFRQNKVIPFLKTLKKTERFPMQQLAIVGDPDFLLCMHGTFVALELKDEGEVPRPLQQHKLDRVAATHGVSIVADPGNWGHVKNVLLQLDRGEYDGPSQVQ